MQQFSNRADQCQRFPLLASLKPARKKATAKENCALCVKERAAIPKQPRSNSVSHGERLVFESLRDRIQMETTRASVLQTALARSRLRFDIWKIV